ncbi:MAG: serine hydrolase [Rhodospirillaceae bacterium]|nr:serine hydrolase [Rhodospirillaceae bacterium]MBT6205601.1 serine hydrolase [Rhodospirillaceae bacterium]MBT6509729.1 serine hydrolase [Rhodospirillaceae bacterium]MBT7614245.1 serine hydrolase [Rhodospirillaceae bacterium]MBT7647573.1 serine hydrolase [Rhodospirillaceae bacterium]
MADDVLKPISAGDGGFDAVKLADAIAFAERHDSGIPLSLADHLGTRAFEDGQWGEILGPTKDRSTTYGVVVRKGGVAASWGDPKRVDMTFSVTKSLLSAVAGVAFDRGLIPDLDEAVSVRIDDPCFQGDSNSQITWHHLLHQTSEWEGTLWDKPDLVDRNRDVVTGDNSKKATHRDLQVPGTHYEYNDVRVNLLSYALLLLFRRPLPEVAKEALLDPCGWSQDWSWNGYRNSHVTIDGEEMWSVSGGGHWGGGLFVDALDLARFGLLYLNKGRWGERQLLSQEWIDLTAKACPIEPRYGFMWWLNTDGLMVPSAPHDAIFALGAGGHLVWVDYKHDLVAVARWLGDDHHDGFVERVLVALV